MKVTGSPDSPAVGFDTRSPAFGWVRRATATRISVCLHQQPSLSAASCRCQRLASPSVSALALEGLDPEQRRVVLAPVGPVCVLAGAGTGKTRAITRRIAHQVVTGQLAGESGAHRHLHGAGCGGAAHPAAPARCAEGVQARTFHAAALRQLGYFWPQAMGGSAAAARQQQGADGGAGGAGSPGPAAGPGVA